MSSPSYIGEFDMVDVDDADEALAGGMASLLSLLIMLEQALTAIAMAAAMIGNMMFEGFFDMVRLVKIGPGKWEATAFSV